MGVGEVGMEGEVARLVREWRVGKIGRCEVEGGVVRGAEWDENLGLGGGRWVRMVLVGREMGWCGEGRMRSGLDWVKEEIR